MWSFKNNAPPPLYYRDAPGDAPLDIRGWGGVGVGEKYFCNNWFLRGGGGGRGKLFFTNYFFIHKLFLQISICYNFIIWPTFFFSTQQSKLFFSFSAGNRLFFHPPPKNILMTVRSLLYIGFGWLVSWWAGEYDGAYM